MKILITTFSLVISTILFAENSLMPKKIAKPTNYVDFGVQGKEYEIKEEDFYKTIIEGAKNIKLDKNKLKLDLEKEVNRLAHFKTKVPYCKDSVVFDSKTEYYTFQGDYFNPMGRVIYKKGDRIKTPPLPDGITKELCFIEGSNKISLANQITFFNKETNDSCLFLVSNANIVDLRNKYQGYQFFPAADMFFDRYDISCLPAKVHFEKSNFQKTNYSIEEFKD